MAVQLYHLGIWFNTPEDAVKAGCPSTATTFTLARIGCCFAILIVSFVATITG